MNNSTRPPRFFAAVSLSLFFTLVAKADVVTDWNQKAADIAAGAKLPAAVATRILAVVQTAVYEAVNAVTKRYPASAMKVDAVAGSSLDAAVAAANRAALTKLLPSQQAAIDSAYQSAVGAIADGPAKTNGIALGEKAADTIVTMCASDGADKAESYRPATTAGVYVPTTLPIVSQWPGRRPRL